jgi:hypothetical protein
MLRSTSALGSDRGITDITRMVIIIRTATTTGRTMATPTTGLIIGTAGTDIITATIVITTITDIKVT